MADFILSSFADEASPMLDEQFAASKEHGFRYIEVRGVDEKNMADYTVEEAKEVARRFADAGIGVSALGSPFGKIDITDDFEPHLEHMKKGLEIANILGTKRVRMFSFFMPKGENPDDYRTPVMERLDKMADLCKGAGNIPQILKAYSAREGEKFVTLEPHLMEFSGLQGLEKDGASMLRYEYTFDNNRQAFDFAVGCLNEIIGSL